MWCVVEYQCVGNIDDPADRPDEWVAVVHGPFAEHLVALAFVARRPARWLTGMHAYGRYEVEQLCAP